MRGGGGAAGGGGAPGGAGAGTEGGHDPPVADSAVGAPSAPLTTPHPADATGPLPGLGAPGPRASPLTAQATAQA